MAGAARALAASSLVATPGWPSDVCAALALTAGDDAGRAAGSRTRGTRRRRRGRCCGRRTTSRTWPQRTFRSLSRQTAPCLCAWRACAVHCPMRAADRARRGRPGPRRDSRADPSSSVEQRWASRSGRARLDVVVVHGTVPVCAGVLCFMALTGLVTAVAWQAEIHDAYLSLAIISWDPEGRKIIPFNQCLPSPTTHPPTYPPSRSSCFAPLPAPKVRFWPSSLSAAAATV